MIPLIYVAGPYRGPTRDAVDLNIATARRVGALAAAKGWYPVIPHSNTAHLDFILPDRGDKFWLDGTLEMMRRCDAVVLCPGWMDSVGTQSEIAEARRLRMPVYWSDYELPPAYAWLAKKGTAAAAGA